MAFSTPKPGNAAAPDSRCPYTRYETAVATMLEPHVCIQVLDESHNSGLKSVWLSADTKKERAVVLQWECLGEFDVAGTPPPPLDEGWVGSKHVHRPGERGAKCHHR